MKKKSTILVVDDMPTILQQAKDVGGERYKIVTTTSGDEAIRLMKKLNPDVILVDIYMPGMDGFECVKEFRSQSDTNEVPIIVMSTEISIATETKGFAMGVSDFIRKPITPEIMFRRIDTQLALGEYRKLQEMEQSET